MSHVLIADSDGNIRKSIGRFLRTQGHTAAEAPDFQSGIDIVEDHAFDVIILDSRLSGGSLMEFFRTMKNRAPAAMIFVSADLDSVETTIQAMKEGAFGLIPKPINITDLGIKVERAIEIKRLQLEAQSLRGERNLIYRTEDIVGESPQIKRVFQAVSKVAASSSSVILIGETGTGKELIAGTIHYNSPRAKGAFVRVNCAALPEQLLESELFGHEKGAFTGADKLRIGRFEQADGGSIFLDEIADMSLMTQAKVLRVLQEKEFERIGSNQTIKTDVRIISATNKDLKECIKIGRFREDLYYRLNVITIRLPPLRERTGDILRLADFFLRKYAGEMNKKIEGLHPLAVRLLTEYGWPGNIRELENTVERAVIMAESSLISPEELNIGDVKENVSSDNPMSIKIPPGGISLEEVEKTLVLQALERSQWIQKDAAGLLKISTRVLNYKIQKFKITHPRWKSNR